MIVACINNHVESLPKKLRKWAITQDENGQMDISLGRHYAVFATREDSYGQWYFVHTDTENVEAMWWMPARLYDIADDRKPTGWIRRKGKEAYPSLFDWKIEEGIIDGEAGAVDIYMSEVEADATFPTRAALDERNKKFERQQRIKDYEDALKLARERGYERPEKPDELVARKMSTLTLRRTRRSYGTPQGVATRSFEDFCIDGASIHDAIFGAGNEKDWHATYLTNLVSPMQRRVLVEMLLGAREPDLPGRRVALYSCPLCFDVSDSLVSTRLEFDDGIVTWSNIAWEDDTGVVDSIEGFEDAYMFDRRQYAKTIESSLRAYEYDGLNAVMNEIDFIGVEPENGGPQDEYDCLVGSVLELLRNGAGKKAVARYLKKEIPEHFGVRVKSYEYRHWTRLIVEWWTTST